jgi:serine/threonine protein kinase
MSKFVNPDAADLVKHMLEVDPAKRYTIEQVASHPFLAPVKPTTEPTKVSLEDELARFKQGDKSVDFFNKTAKKRPDDASLARELARLKQKGNGDDDKGDGDDQSDKGARGDVDESNAKPKEKSNGNSGKGVLGFRMNTNRDNDKSDGAERGDNGDAGYDSDTPNEESTSLASEFAKLKKKLNGDNDEGEGDDRSDSGDRSDADGPNEESA